MTMAGTAMIDKMVRAEMPKKIVIVISRPETAIRILTSIPVALPTGMANMATPTPNQPTWVPPTVTKRVPLEIYIVPEYIVLSLVFLIILAIIAAVLPARRAARMSIIDALGHV